MKQTVLILCLLTAHISNAQFTKGDKLLSGVLSLSTQRAPESQNGGPTNVVNSLSLYPSIGFFVSEKLAVGGRIGYSDYYYKFPNYQSTTSEYDSRSFSTGVFAARYFKISDNFLFSVGGLFQFSRGTDTNTYTDNSTNTSTEDKTKTYSLTTSISPSFIFFPSQRWGFSASVGSIGHTYSKNLSTDAPSNNFSINYGTISLGIAYFIRRPIK